MKTTEKYLEKTSQHLFEIKNDRTTTYMKVLVIGDKFTVLKFDENFNVISDKTYNISDYQSVSPNGKTYVDTFLKNGLLFYKESSYDNTKIRSIKHFKKFHGRLEEYMSIKETTQEHTKRRMGLDFMYRFKKQ